MGDLDAKLTLEVVDFSDLKGLWEERWVAAALDSLPPALLTAAGVALRGVAADVPGKKDILARIVAFGASSSPLPHDASHDASRDAEAATAGGNGHSPVLPELHVLSSPGLGYAVFHPPTFALFRVNKLAAAVLEDLREGMPIDAVAGRHGLSAEEVAALVARIDRATSACPPARAVGEEPGTLQKLVLNVSNDCNMRCRYCYAGGGAYGQSRGLMTTEVARQAIERVFEHFRRVHTVMFFGGEPTLNVDAIEVCCDRLVALYNQNAIPRLPRLGMVTNGLALSQRMLDIIQRYDLAVAVSLDGPPVINDILRLTRDGQGSFRRVARNIRRIQAITSGHQPARVEATYTAAHRTAGLTPMDLADYFTREFGIGDSHVAPVTVEPGHRLCWGQQRGDAGVFRETAAQLVESWSTENPRQLFSISRCLLSVATGRGLPYLCGAGLTELTVSASGDVYPCYVLFKDKFRMGSVADPRVFQSERFHALQQRFRDNAKEHITKCSRCWVRGFCRVCFRVPYLENQTIDCVPDRVCDQPGYGRGRSVGAQWCSS